MTTARTHVHVRDWREAIAAACAPLVESGAIEQRYADRCVATVEEQGPYIVLEPGLALAHARPEDGAHALALGVAVVEPPVEFGHELNDPVDVVLVFASPDREMHTSLLASLARRLLTGFAGELRHARNDDDACQMLEKVINDDQAGSELWDQDP